MTSSISLKFSGIFLSDIFHYLSEYDIFGYSPNRQVRTGYVPPKPEWSDEKKNQWNKIQAMLGRYPGNEQYKISCSTAVESIKSSRSCSFYLGADSEATPYGPFNGYTGPYGSGKRVKLPQPRDTTAWLGVQWR